MTSGLLVNAWTGGQYSLFRATFGVYLFCQFVQGTPFGIDVFGALVKNTTAPLNPMISNLLSAGDSPYLIPAVLAVGAMASTALALGRSDRAAAVLLLVLWASCSTRSVLASTPAFGLIGGLLVAQAFLPPRPFGSWDARDRLDPDDGWKMPNTIYLSGWFLLGLGYFQLGAAYFSDGAIANLGQAWAGFALTHFFTFNPAWIRSSDSGGQSIVFYDGACGLCHQTIRILLAEDSAGRHFRFAPLESVFFQSAIAAPGSGFQDDEPIPDSVLVKRPGEAMLARAAGVLELGHQLGGLWRLASIVLGWLPTTLLDSGYDFIASIRHRLFKRPVDACPLLPAHLRERFEN